MVVVRLFVNSNPFLHIVFCRCVFLVESYRKWKELQEVMYFNML